MIVFSFMKYLKFVQIILTCHQAVKSDSRISSVWRSLPPFVCLTFPEMHLIFLCKGRCQSVCIKCSLIFLLNKNSSLLSGLCYVPHKAGRSKHNFHDAGKKLHSQNEKLIGRDAGDSIKVLGFFNFIF